MTKEKSTAVAVIDNSRLAALRNKGGAGESAGSTWPEALHVNRNPLTKDDKPLPMGKFAITVKDQKLFLETADIIIFTKGTQFRRWRKDNTYAGCTMIEQPGKADFKDTLGTVKVGKFVGETLTAAQEELNKEIKFYFMMLGIVDISAATTADGTKAFDSREPVWHPMKLEYTGKKAVEKQDELKKLKKRDEANFDFITRLTKPHRAGEAAGVPYYDYNFERGDNTAFTEDILLSIEAAQALIAGENVRIYKLHLAAQSDSAIHTSEEDDEDLSSLDLGGE